MVHTYIACATCVRLCVRSCVCVRACVVCAQVETAEQRAQRLALEKEKLEQMQAAMRANNTMGHATLQPIGSSDEKRNEVKF